MIYAQSYEFLNVVFIRHSGFPDSDTPRVCSENAAKNIEGSHRYDRLMEHVVYTGLQQC